MHNRDRAMESGRDPGVRRQSHFANTSDLSREEGALLDTPTGREDGEASEVDSDLVASEARAIDVDGVPMSELTGHPDPGTTRETIDGLDETAEATRRAAEDYVPDRD